MSEYERRRESTTPGISSGSSTGLEPGKRTLTSRLTGPIQARADAASDGASRGAGGPPAASGGGSPLPDPVRTQMETSFGADFSSVRVHEDDRAASIGAQAYAQGTNVHFAPGQYDPGSRGGQELIGHELAHVVQQSQGRVSAPGQAKGDGDGVNEDAGLEAEADAMGARAAAGEPAGGAIGGQIAGRSDGAVQAKRMSKAQLGQLHDTSYRNIRAMNFDLAVVGVHARIKEGEADKEDVDAIAGFDFAHGAVSDIMTGQIGAEPIKGEKQSPGDQVIGFDQSWKDRILALRNDADEVDAERKVAAPGGADEGFAVLVDAPGKGRIQVPTAFASTAQVRELSSIRWSQSDVKAATQEGTPLETVIGHMVRGGWRGEPCTVVNVTATITLNGQAVPSGVPVGLTSQDNRRLLAAMTAGLSQVPCVIHDCNAPLPDTWPVEDRDSIKKPLYLDKTDKSFRYGNTGDGFTKTGKMMDKDRFETLLAKGHIATTYGELIFIRSANQPGVAATGESFPVGGSKEAPRYKAPKPQAPSTTVTEAPTETTTSEETSD